MNKEKFLETIEAIKKHLLFYGKNTRLGYAFISEFKIKFPDVVEQIRPTEDNCFSDDSKIINFIEKVFELTNTTKECKELWYSSEIYYYLINKC